MMPDNFSQSDKQDQNTSRSQPIWGIEYKLLACEHCKWVYLVKVEVNPKTAQLVFIRPWCLLQIWKNILTTIRQS